MNFEHLMNTEQLFYVKRMRMLSWLIDRGFKDYEVINDPISDKGYNWFVFRRTPEFDKAVTEYFAQFKK